MWDVEVARNIIFVISLDPKRSYTPWRDRTCWDDGGGDAMMWTTEMHEINDEITSISESVSRSFIFFHIWLQRSTLVNISMVPSSSLLEGFFFAQAPIGLGPLHTLGFNAPPPGHWSVGPCFPRPNRFLWLFWIWAYTPYSHQLGPRFLFFNIVLYYVDLIKDRIRN